MTDIVNIADIVNQKTGVTFRQENNAMQHKYKVDDLMEINYEDSEYHEIRLYIIGLSRDCDGTPLYVLGTKGMELYQVHSPITPVKENTLYNFGAISGFGEDSLTLIKEA